MGCACVRSKEEDDVDVSVVMEQPEGGPNVSFTEGGVKFEEKHVDAPGGEVFIPTQKISTGIMTTRADALEELLPMKKFDIVEW